TLSRFFCSSSRRHTRFSRHWSSDVCSSDLTRIRFADSRVIVCCILVMFVVTSTSFAQKQGVGVKPPKGAEVFFDGSRKMLDEKWTYWEGPRLAAQLPIKWQIVDDPVDKGTVMNANDPAAAGGEYGAADIVTRTWQIGR